MKQLKVNIMKLKQKIKDYFKNSEKGYAKGLC